MTYQSEKNNDSQKLSVTKRSGQIEVYDEDKLIKSLRYYIAGLKSQIDLDLLVKTGEANLFNGIKTQEIFTALIFAARSLIEKDPAYSQLAARLLWADLYKQVIGRDQIDFDNLTTQYQRAFISNIKILVDQGRFDQRMLDYDLELLAQSLKPERDNLINYLGAQVLIDRYFWTEEATANYLETPQAFWMRVAMGLAIQESDKNQRAVEFYEVVSTLRFVPSTPTLFHSGTIRPQLSSCYLTTIDDSLDHIFKCLSDDAQMSKWSGGVANDWTNLRATGARIKGTGVESQGVIPFLKIANDTTVAINRSGRRRGATCAYLETWHYDIEDFLELRKNTGDERRRTYDLNTANWIPDLFMERLEQDGEWTLFSPEEVSDLHHLYGHKFKERYQEYERLANLGQIKLSKKISARELWKKMLMMLFETGHPWITFKDACNIRSPQDHVGVINSSNLCTEITLNTSFEETAVCNLGSVNLAKHISNGKLDEDLLKSTVKTAVRMLDNVIDINFYPVVEGRTANLLHRPIGLGLMGHQDALFMLDLNFASEEAVDFADTSTELLAYSAISASKELAKERGAYPTFKGSKWDRGILPLDTLDLLAAERGQPIPVPRSFKLDWDKLRSEIKKFGLRNSNCLAIAPTATISNIAGCYPSIEPIYKNIYVKSNMSGEFTVINSYLVEDLKKLNFWTESIIIALKRADGNLNLIADIPLEIKKKYQEVFAIEPEWLIKAASRRAKWLDQSQSLNIFFNGKSGKLLGDIYLLAWKLGIKTTYYLRTLSATSVEKSTISLNAAVISETVETIISDSVVAVTETVTAIDTLAIDPSTSIKLCKLNDPTCESCQ